MNRVFLILSLVAFSAMAAGAATNAPTTRPTTRPWVGLKPILLTIPESLYPAPTKQWTKLKAELANDALKKVIGREAMLTLNVREVAQGDMPDDSPDEQDTCRLAAQDLICDTWRVAVQCYFPNEEKLALAAVNIDDQVTVVGRVSRCEFSFESRRGWVLYLALSDSRLIIDPAERRWWLRR